MPIIENVKLRRVKDVFSGFNAEIT